MIKVCDLQLKYNDEIIASNINFTVDEGDFFLIIGENGSGKTSLLKSLLKENYNYSGHIYIDDIEIQKYKQWTNIGYVPQKTNINHDLPITVKEYLALYTNNENDIEKLLKKFELEYLINGQINNLSGGEFQKINIIKVLLGNIKYLFLDEPDSNLDEAFKQKMYDILREINSQKITIVLITHNLDIVNLNINNKKMYNMKTGELEIEGE